MKKILCALSACLILACVAQAAVLQWDNGGVGSEWNTTNNWDQTYLPGATTTDRVILKVGDHATISSGNAVSSPSMVDLHMQHSAATLDIGANLGRLRRLTGLVGTVTQTAGAVEFEDTASNSVIGNNGIWVISGGSYAMRGDLAINSNGTFSVIGSAASVSVGNGTGDNLTVAGYGKLGFTLDASGVSAIAVTDTFTVDGVNSLLTVDGSAYTGGNADITLVNAATMTGTYASGKYTVTGMGVEGTDWTLTQGTNGDVVLNVIPEPATLGLIGFLGVGLMTIRRFMLV